MERREFLKLMGVGAGVVGTGALAAPSLAQDGGDAGMDMGTPEPTAPVSPEATPPVVDVAAVDAMDHHHQMGIQTFLDNMGTDDLFWHRPIDYTMDGDTKVFQMTCSEINWETKAGTSYPSFAFNGIVPGPEFRVTEGDKLRILVTNYMTQSTSVHWHGLLIPNNMDGVPFINQQPIKPGETFTYEFKARNPGSHMYHSHHNSTEQVTRGLLGSFVIEPLDKSREPVVDHEYTLILNNSAMGFTINGKEFPYTQPVTAKLGEKIRIRYMNEGLMIHPMHLHGMPQLVFAKDGWYLPMPYMADTLLIAPGERYDTVVDCTEPGIWAFHCHILSHAESRDGMFGMVTVLAVSE